MKVIHSKFSTYQDKIHWLLRKLKTLLWLMLFIWIPQLSLNVLDKFRKIKSHPISIQGTNIFLRYTICRQEKSQKSFCKKRDLAFQAQFTSDPKLLKNKWTRYSSKTFTRIIWRALCRFWRRIKCSAKLLRKRCW